MTLANHRLLQGIGRFLVGSSTNEDALVRPWFKCAKTSGVQTLQHKLLFRLCRHQHKNTWQIISGPLAGRCCLESFYRQDLPSYVLCVSQV